jgi:hypothetical protein
MISAGIEIFGKAQTLVGKRLVMVSFLHHLETGGSKWLINLGASIRHVSVRRIRQTATARIPVLKARRRMGSATAVTPSVSKRRFALIRRKVGGRTGGDIDDRRRHCCRAVPAIVPRQKEPASPRGTVDRLPELTKLATRLPRDGWWVYLFVRGRRSRASGRLQPYYRADGECPARSF